MATINDTLKDLPIKFKKRRGVTGVMMKKNTEKLKSELKSERERRLQKIREKKRRKEQQKNAEEQYDESEEEKSLEEELGFEVHKDIDVRDRERKAKKKDEESIEKKKQREMEAKSAKSSRDQLTEKIKDLEDQISNTKYNKKTQHAIGLMKAQLASLKSKLNEKNSKSSGAKDGYSVRKTGDGSVALLGFPSAGKSTLLNKLTNAQSEVGEYAFTTLKVIPGILHYNHAQIQILDVPGIVYGAASGAGRGKEVLQVIRSCDLILILVDALKPQQLDALKKEVHDSNVRINVKKPDVTVRKTAKDGIRIGRTVSTPELTDETIKAILRQFRIMNAEIVIREEIDAQQLIDVVEGNKAYISAITVINKSDLLTGKQLDKVKKVLKPDLCISAANDVGLAEVKDLIYDKLSLIRIYMKEIDKKADMEEPMIIKSGSTLHELAEKVHKDFVKNFRFARVWGNSVKFAGQKLLKLDHTLEDEDIVEIHTY